MDRSEAREHLAMVDRILGQAENRPFRPMAGLLIVWGIAAALMDAGEQAYVLHHTALYVYAGEIALILAMLISVVIAGAAVRNADCLQPSERRLGRAIGAVWICVVCAALSQPHVFAGWSAAGIWSLGAAMTLLISAFSGDRTSLVGGILLLASLIVANFLTPHIPGYTLAAGMFLGYAVPGVVLALRGARGGE